MWESFELYNRESYWDSLFSISKCAYMTVLCHLGIYDGSILDMS